MDDAVLRKALVGLLREENAHAGIDAAIKDIDPKIINKRPGSNSHSIWELFEHMRLTQEDIIRYTMNTSWQSPAWPEGYWPKENEEATQKKWEQSVKQFNKDFDEVIRLVENTNIDLTSEIPGGEGRTYLRQILLVADHNAYHVAQIIMVRKLLGSWH